VIPALLKTTEQNKCVWLEAVQFTSFATDNPNGSDTWFDAWEWILQRLNERREYLMRRLSGGLVLSMPKNIRARVGILAPDLWSIRTLAIELDKIEIRESLKAIDEGPIQRFDEWFNKRINLELTNYTIQQLEKSDNVRQEGRIARLMYQIARDAFLGDRSRKHLDEAIDLLKIAINIDEDLNDQPSLIIDYIEMGFLQYAIGSFDEARVWQKKAIAIAEMRGDQSKMEAVYSNLSQIDHVCGRLDEAETWLKKAIVISEMLRNLRNLTIYYNNMSQIEKARGRLDAAQAWLKKAIAIAEALNDKPNLAIRYNNMSTIEQARGRLDAAEAWLKKAIAIAEALDDKPNLAPFYNNMSQIERDRGRLDAAQVWLQKAIAIKEEGDPRR
jgi:tetratricopeptide (TPR) repeat protein